MTAEAALYQFFSSFGIDAYAETSVPDANDKTLKYPYLTYSQEQGTYLGEGVQMTVNIWYYTDSEAQPNAKVREIYEVLRDGGIMLSCDDGSIWLTLGEPWCQSLVDEADRKIKRRYLNITRQDLRY